MKIKKGDTVVVRTGKNRGAQGSVLATMPALEQVLVEGVGVVKRHRRSTRRGQAGQIVERATPVHVSNVALLDPKTKTPTRVGYEVRDGKKVRIMKKSGTTA